MGLGWRYWPSLWGTCLKKNLTSNRPSEPRGTLLHALRSKDKLSLFTAPSVEAKASLPFIKYRTVLYYTVLVFRKLFHNRTT